MTKTLQKTENVANNVANKNSQDLTEQFDNDKITKGSYYCKSKLDGHICIAGFINYKGLFDCNYNGTLNKGYWEILAEVPDYVEWRNMVNCACEEHEANKRLIEKNAQLKELLKECKEIFDECFSPSAKHGELYKQIDEALQ